IHSASPEGVGPGAGSQIAESFTAVAQSKSGMVLQAAGGYCCCPPTFAWENGESRKMATESFPIAVVAEPSESERAELDLVSRAREGDSNAFSALIRRYEGK